MKVYIVAGEYHYEGADTDSIKVFTDKDKAYAYGEELMNDEYYGFHEYTVVEQELE
jgi:hypothetical protein